MKFLLAIIYFPIALIRFILLLLSTAIILSIASVRFSIEGYNRDLQKWTMHNWGKWITWIMGIRIKKNQLPEKENFILMPNHRSYIDIPLVVRFMQGTLVGKAEVGAWPMAMRAAKICRPIMVKRSVMRSLVETMNKIKESVNNNTPVILFPEGTTSKGPMTKPFKNGTFKIAADANIPIIPMAINYKNPADAWIDDDTFFGHFFMRMGKPVTDVEIRFGSPITNPDHKLLKAETKKQIDTMLKEIAG